MLDLDEKRFASFINDTLLKMSQNDRKIASMTRKVEEINPLLFFSVAKKLTPYRTFWMSTNDDFFLVSAGNIYNITATENRFKKTQSAWESILRHAEVYNPYETPGTGLVALGGMSFDPLEEKSSLWENFAAGQLHIPEILITKYNGDFYLTKNTYLSKEDDPHTIAKELLEKERMLLTEASQEQPIVTLESKHEIDPEQWRQAVHQARETIRHGDVEKIVMAREMRLTFSDEVNVTSVIKKLQVTQPNSYVFAFDHGEDCFVGATPERLVKVEKENMLSTCLAGTSPRGKTKEEDEKLSHEFLNDQKNLEEHDFVVQMIRKGIEEYCTNVDIPRTPTIYKLKNLQHLYTPVKAKLKKEATIFDIIKKLHPTPALGGTPTKEALAFIRSHEILERGWYGAPIGWVDSNQNGEFVVGIRSGLIQKDEASLFAGCGIVKDSDIDAEYQETGMKFLPMLNVLQENN